MRRRTINKYEGFSFVEVIITLLIVSMVLIVTSATLAALIRASAISSAKTMSRSESEFILEILEKAIKNSQSEQIFLFKTYSTIDYNTGDIEYDIVGEEHAQISLDSGTPANEIHFRPVRSKEWVCIGYTKDVNDIGYIVKSSSTIFDPDCLLNGPIVVLNSDEVDIETLDIVTYTTSGGNYAFLVDLVLEPVHWLPSEGSKFKPTYARQLFVTTEKLTY